MNIQIKGARENNLKNIDVHIGDGLTVVTGVSGSGKTSLVFDTLYHEARRRLVDVISTSRPGGWQHQLSKAKFESISGLGPAVSVGQNILNRNPLSTLATASGLHPFLRLFYARFGARHCPQCGASITVLSPDEMIEQILAQAKLGTVQVFAPLLHRARGSHRMLLNTLTAEFGKQACLLDGKPWNGEPLEHLQSHDLDIYLGELDSASKALEVRQMVTRAASLGAQSLRLAAKEHSLTLASAPACSECGAWFGKLEPKHFHLPCPYCKAKGCQACAHTGMHPLAAGVDWQQKRLPELLKLTVSELGAIFSSDLLPTAARRLQTEIMRRLQALERVGLGYLSLDRQSPTLSRGESQRVRLAVSLTSPLEDMLHVLDEPTIGQHPADVSRFLPAFREFPGPVIFVEHDRVAAAAADQAIDLGPGAGQHGGEIVFQGAPADLWRTNTPTGRYFSLRQRVMAPELRKPPTKFLNFYGANQHNLQQIDIQLPLNRLTVISGVSGSGKSTLVEHVIVPSLEKRSPIGCRAIEGPKIKPVFVDQSPIGHNPRSNPATYTKLSDNIRTLFSSESTLSPSHFSFNRPEGACPTCNGMGAIEVKMKFLQSIWVPCSDCDAQRFNDETLDVRLDFEGHRLSIADFYQLPVGETAALFARETRLPPNSLATAQRILAALTDVGLEYLTLGQPSPSLSGGEAQRVKLSKYLGRAGLEDRLLVLDEPSTGLHPKDLDGLLTLLDRLVRAGATILVVEHNTDIIQAADWVIDLGPGAGPEGGQLLYAGNPEGLLHAPASLTGKALREEAQVQPRSASVKSPAARVDSILIRGARANNLKSVDVDIPKGKLTLVTGLSGSGKSSLVTNVLEAEARRRYLESLSMYERQGTREGPEAPVDSVSGLGVTLTIQSAQTHIWSSLSHFTRRATVGTASELYLLLAVLLAHIGEHDCPLCRLRMERGENWHCPACGVSLEIPKPRHFSTQNYASACPECTGLGMLYQPKPEKLIIHPHKPLCGGAIYSPGYWPQTYLCQDTGIAQALGAHYGFDPHKTPWNEMSAEARHAFLFGDQVKHEFTYQSKGTGEIVTRRGRWEGFYGGWVRDWDVHGTYTQPVPCPECGGSGLKPDILAVTLAGANFHALGEMSLRELKTRLDELLIPSDIPTDPYKLTHNALVTARLRLRFLENVGLAYLLLNRTTGTLSAGESQRIQLARLLGSELTSLTVLLDEPSRGMHPRELDALISALKELRSQGNTVVVVEHDLQLIQSADHIIELGPGAGVRGGRLLASGSPDDITRSDTPTGTWLRAVHGEQNTALSSYSVFQSNKTRRQPSSWLVIKGASENNLRGQTVEIPLGVLAGFCGVSGSGKSTLLIDTLGRALVPKTHTTSFAHEPMQPGAYEAIEGAPPRAVLVDQSTKEIHNPASFLGLTRPLLKLYAQSQEALALGMDEKTLGRQCSACKGSGVVRLEMGFLPDVFELCETCQGTGAIPEAWQVRVNGYALPEINALTLDEVHALFADDEKISRTLEIAHQVGLGYLVWRQPAYTLSGGEAQRLKIARELCRKSLPKTLYIFDEPTVGLHMQDIQSLIQVLQRLVEGGNSVVLVEHHLHLLAACDWLIELGPGGGPEGGLIIASGTPEQVSQRDTPTAPYLRQVLDGLERLDPAEAGE